MRRIALLLLFTLSTVYCLLSTPAHAQEVDLLWQGETYTPPLYQGRALWSKQSQITLYAIPHIPGTDPSALIYRWKKDGTVLGRLSGVNQRSITFTDSVLSLPIEVKLDVFKEEGTDADASATIVLRATTPHLIVIEDNPLYGLMLHRAVLDEFELPEPEVTFVGLPLYARVSRRDAPALTYSWLTNTGDTRTGNSVTYRAPEDESGSSLIKLRVSNAGVLTQPAPKDFLVQFGENNEEGNDF